MYRIQYLPETSHYPHRDTFKNVLGQCIMDMANPFLTYIKIVDEATEETIIHLGRVDKNNWKVYKENY